MTFVLLAQLGFGLLLMAFSATPEAVLMRAPLGGSVVRARVEIGVLGAGIVASAFAIYLLVGSS